MDIVYWLTFTNRVQNKTPPYYYIGSKRNCTIVNGIIIDDKNHEYWSSCKQQRFVAALMLQKPSVKILHVCNDALDEEEFYHRHYDVVKSKLFYNKAMAKGTFKSSLKGVNKSSSHITKMKESSHLRGIQPWNHPNTISKNAHLIWLHAEVFYNWYIGPHRHSRLGPKLMSKETGIHCSHMTGISIINRFKSGWNPHLDLEYKQFKLKYSS